MSTHKHTHTNRNFHADKNAHTDPRRHPERPPQLTGADAFVVQLSGGVPEVAHPAVLAVLAPGVVLAAHTGHNVQVVDVATAVRVAVTLTV